MSHGSDPPALTPTHAHAHTRPYTRKHPHAPAPANGIVALVFQLHLYSTSSRVSSPFGYQLGPIISLSLRSYFHLKCVLPRGKNNVRELETRSWVCAPKQNTVIIDTFFDEKITLLDQKARRILLQYAPADFSSIKPFCS